MPNASDSARYKALGNSVAIPCVNYILHGAATVLRDMLQLEESEYDLIRYPQRGVCLYKCGNERYLLEVHAPPHKEALFGSAGGR